MALYEGLRDRSESLERPVPPRAPQPAREWKSYNVELRPKASRPSFFDNMLGQGSQAKVKAALRSQPAPAVPAAAWAKPKMEVVGSAPSAVPAGKKGVGRSILALGLLGFGLLHFRPWKQSPAEATPLRRVQAPTNGNEGGWAKDFASLFHASTDVEKAHEEALKASAEREAQQQEAAHLAALPVNAAGGEALALWQDGSGKWWQVNAKAELRPCSGPADKDSLGLPELRGVAADAEEHAGGKRLSLRLPHGLLKELLPLEPSVASEVRAILLDDPAQPALLTHDGTRCLLDATDWERRQRRLGLVLADLAAKKRRASLIDLRYEDTAVVRPAGRG